MQEVCRANVVSIKYFHGVVSDLLLDLEIAATQGKDIGWLASNGERLWLDIPVPTKIKVINGTSYMDVSEREKYLRSS